MPIFEQADFNVGQLMHITEQLPAAVTIIDLNGNMLYYNAHAPKLLNRKPEHLGKDIRDCHKRDSSNQRIDAMIQEFEAGSREPIQYTATPYGEPIVVTVAPLILDGKLKGCIQHAVKKTE